MMGLVYMLSYFMSKMLLLHMLVTLVVYKVLHKVVLLVHREVLQVLDLVLIHNFSRVRQSLLQILSHKLFY